MKLEFYDLSELDAFLAWAGRGRIGSAIVIGADPEPMTGEVLGTVDTTGEVNVSEGPQGTETAVPAPAPRKRRTKAEIEAENATKTGGIAVIDAHAETPAQAAIRQALEAAKLSKEAKEAGNPAAAQALLEAGAKVLTPHAANQHTNAAAEPTSALSPTDPKLLPHEFIQKRAAEIGEMQAIEHLNAARNFIAKHGMAKYNESFPLCGLHANVMQFTPAECALHAAALEWLDKA